MFWFAAVCMIAQTGFSQIVYEHFVYAQDSVGDIEFRENIITNYNDTGLVVATGNYKFGQDSTYAHNKVVVDKRNFNGTGGFHYYYTIKDSSGNILEVTANSIVEDSLGYIIVGGVKSKNDEGISGGGDMLLMKVNTNGSVSSAKRVDVGGGNDVANAIVDKDGNHNTFLICGNSTKTTGEQNGVVLQINKNLTISWLTDMKFQVVGNDTGIVTLNDLVVDGDYIWTVGGYKDKTYSSTQDGLVVRMNTSGTYSDSRYADYNGELEELLAVENDGSYLAICGKSSVSAGGTNLLAWKYDKTYETVYRAREYKLHNPSAAGNMYSTVGNDIKIFNDGESAKAYFIVGESVNSAGTTTIGMLYKLNDYLTPIHQEYYSSKGNNGLYATELHTGNTYLSHVGWTSTSTPRNKGYVLKSDLQGATACSDTIGTDTIVVYPETFEFIESDDNQYADTGLIEVKDTLLDSLICIDTLAGGAYKRAVGIADQINTSLLISPNPVRQGSSLIIRMGSTDYSQYCKIYNSVGKLVYELRLTGDNVIEIPTGGFSMGLYIGTVGIKDQEGRFKDHQFKFIVE